jgi:hypothetical protein
MNRTIPFILVLLFAVSTGFLACEDDPEPAPADERLAFTGTWRVNETETKLTYEVDIQIDPRSQNGGVYIYNFANAGSSSAPAYAYVSGNTITLEVNQVIGDGWVINGSGILSGSTIDWPYTLNDGANLYAISAVFQKI